MASGQGQDRPAAFGQALHEMGYTGTISIELEDVPGVARSGARAMAAFEAENQAALAYLRALFVERGIPIDERL